MFDGLHSFRYFQVLQSVYQSFGDCTQGTNYNWYNRHFHILQFLARSSHIFFFSLSFNFTLWSAGTAKFTIVQVLSFLSIIIRCGRPDEIRWSVCISKFFRSLSIFFLQDRFWFVHIPFIRMVKLQFFAQFQVDHFAYPVVLLMFFQESLSLDSLYLSSYFYVFWPIYQSFMDCSKYTNWNWNHRHLPVP